MHRAGVTPTKYQSAWKRFVLRICLNGLPHLDDLSYFFLSDPPLEHPLDGMNPKDQAKLAHSVATFALFTCRLGPTEKKSSATLS